MITPGTIILLNFPQADLQTFSIRPDLLLKETPSRFDDWLVCMVSSQIHQHIEGFGEIINKDDSDFPTSRLKTTSVIRLDRLLTVSQQRFRAELGNIDQDRLQRLYNMLAKWFTP